MEILFLGTGTGSPNPDRAPASALVRAGGRKVLFDFGSGILRRLAQEGHDHLGLDAICLTHFHPDHTLDLWAWLFALSYDRRDLETASTALVADQSFGVVHEGLKLAYGDDIRPRSGRLGLTLINRTETPQNLRLPQLPGFELSLAPAEHRPESLAFRLEYHGISLVYSGDTGWSEAVAGLAQGVDCLILEATRPEGAAVTGHLTPALAGQLAQKAGAKSLILTHLSASHGRADPAEAARAHFSGPVQTARDGLKITLGQPGQGLNPAD